MWSLPQKFNSDAADMYLLNNGAHYVWATRPTSGNAATVLAEIPGLYQSGIADVPLIATKTYGNGRFIYHSEMAPLAGWGGYAPDTSEYVFYRAAIQSAFSSAGLPLVRLAAGATSTAQLFRPVGTVTSTTWGSRLSPT